MCAPRGYLGVRRRYSVLMRTDLGRGPQEFFAQPQYEEGREEEAHIWGQETHDVPRVHRAESGITSIIKCFMSNHLHSYQKGTRGKLLRLSRDRVSFTLLVLHHVTITTEI